MMLSPWLSSPLASVRTSAASGAIGGVGVTGLGESPAQGQIGLGQLAHLAPEHGEERGAVRRLQIGRQRDRGRPIVGLELLGGLGEALLEILEQVDHVVLAHPAGRRGGAARLQGGEMAAQMAGREVDLDLLAVEVVEEGVAEHLGQIDLGEERQLQRIARRCRARTAGEAGHQTGRLLAVAGRVHVLDEVEPPALDLGLQLPALPGREGGDQIGLAGLRQAEEADADRASGRASEPRGEVAGAPAACRSGCRTRGRAAGSDGASRRPSRSPRRCLVRARLRRIRSAARVSCDVSVIIYSLHHQGQRGSWRGAPVDA
jgi:hypothetical protein